MSAHCRFANPTPRRSTAISLKAPVRPFMPRDHDKNNAPPRGRREGPAGGKGRSGAARGPEKKFAKRGFAGKSDSAGGPEKKSYGKKPYSGPGKPYAGKREGVAPHRDDDRAPRRDYGDAPRPARFHREDRPARSGGVDRPDRGPRKDFRPREGRGDKRPYTPRSDGPRGDRGDARPAARFSEKKFGDKKPYTPRGDRPRGDSPRGDSPQGDRPYGGGPQEIRRGQKIFRPAPGRPPGHGFRH